MEYFSTKDIGRTFLLRLDQGDYILESINDLIRKEKINNGVVISAIGTADKCVLHMVTTTGYPPKEHFEKWGNKPLEISSIHGIIADGKPHLHAVVSDCQKAYSGHLEKGCRVLYLAELVIMELKSIELTRILDKKNISKLTLNKKQNS